MPRISVFVDAANLFYVQHRLGWHINPQRLLDHIVGLDQLADAFWYTGVRIGPGGEAEQEKFLKWLTHAGYSVRRKSIKSFVNVDRGGTVEKANLDVEIVMDMLTTADTYDVAALVSGDGDFERIVEHLRARGKRVRAYSIDPVIAFELRNAVGTHYVDFWTIRSEVERLEDVPIIPPVGPAPHLPLHNAVNLLQNGTTPNLAANTTTNTPVVTKESGSLTNGTSHSDAGSPPPADANVPAPPAPDADAESPKAALL
ncbi:MAG: NYN domain-containing protein [Planctomycetota bacterium]